MIAVRPVNRKIGNLRRHTVAAILRQATTLILEFRAHLRRGAGFTLRLEGVLGFVDRGVVARPLTAGIVWNPVAQYGTSLAVRAGREPGGLMELRLDFEDASGLVARFNAVAETIRLVRPPRRRKHPRVRPRPPNS